MQVCIKDGAIRVIEAVVVLNIQKDARPACIAKACDSVDASAIASQQTISRPSMPVFPACMVPDQMQKALSSPYHQA